MKQVPRKGKTDESTIGRVGFGENGLFTALPKMAGKWQRRETTKINHLIKIRTGE